MGLIFVDVIKNYALKLGYEMQIITKSFWQHYFNVFISIFENVYSWDLLTFETEARKPTESLQI